MLSKIRHFVAYLLLLLLPLHAIAGVSPVTCPMMQGQGSMSSQTMDCCDHEIHETNPAIDNFDGSTLHHPEYYSGSSPCGLSPSCMVAMSSLLHEAHALTVEPSSSAIDFAERFYLSFIPEGLQRPPQTILA